MNSPSPPPLFDDTNKIGLEYELWTYLLRIFLQSPFNFLPSLKYENCIRSQPNMTFLCTVLCPMYQPAISTDSTNETHDTVMTVLYGTEITQSDILYPKCRSGAVECHEWEMFRAWFADPATSPVCCVFSNKGCLWRALRFWNCLLPIHSHSFILTFSFCSFFFSVLLHSLSRSSSFLCPLHVFHLPPTHSDPLRFGRINPSTARQLPLYSLQTIT